MLLKGMEFDTAHFITDVSGKYPRLWALKGAHPVTVNRWYKFGVLASIRTIAPGFREISELPDWVGRKRIKAVLGIAEGIQDYGITCCGCVIEVCGASSPCKTRWIRPGSTSVKKLLDGNGADVDRTEIQHIRNRVVWLKKVEKAYLGQLTKNKYILNQDTNSKYFYALVKKNKKRNHITHLITDDGATTSEGEVAERFVHYFESLLGAVSPGNGVVNGVLDLDWFLAHLFWALVCDVVDDVWGHLPDCGFGPPVIDRSLSYLLLGVVYGFYPVIL
ncbi:hypothetical protein ACS0TY_000662 [Phlomoides rotata]